MPTHEGFGPDDRDGLEDRWKPSIQLDQEQAISVRELDTTAHPPLQHNQLMTERRVLGLKSAPRLRQNRAIIAADVRRFGHVINTDGVLGTHKLNFRR